MNSNIATAINILAEQNLDINFAVAETIPFKIKDKIEFNCLRGVDAIIDDYKIFYHKIDEIYQEFDIEGKNKSISVLQGIRTQYIKLKQINNSAEEIFYKIIENLIDIVRKSNNYTEIPIEELQMCVSILVVDAFIRCKIFENPEGYL